MKFLLTAILLISGSEVIKCADILVLIPTPFYSHQATFRPLWRELAKRGHKITLITTDPMEKNENITQIDYSGVYSEKKKMESNLYGTTNPLNVFKLTDTAGKILTYQLTHPDLLKLYKEKKKFDLVFVELLLPIFAYLSVKFDCPFIGLNTMDAVPSLHAAVGNAVHPVVYPFNDFGFEGELTFTERLKSIAFTLGYFGIMNPFFGYFGNSYIRKYVGEDIPDIYELQRNVSAIFINANPLFFPTRPVTPITVNLGGGLHLSEPKRLPEDLQKYLDDSTSGCIYVSFGTTVNSAYLSKDQKGILVNVFKEMAPMRVLWKFDEVNVAKGADNVEVRTWVPQQDILRHPNIKVFITQGGLQSMEEAIDSAVPMLGMPFYGDQSNNVNKMEKKKFGLKLLPKELNEKSLKAALEELLNNKMYKTNIEKLSAIARDQPMNGLEKAIWWTEYVLRHGGTQHLRSPSADIPLYQYFFLDVIFVISIFLFFAYVVLRALYKLSSTLVKSAYNMITHKVGKNKRE